MSNSNSTNSSPESAATKSGKNLNVGDLGSPGTTGDTSKSPGGNTGGGALGGNASGSTTQPSVTFVHGKDAKMLTGKKKPTHDSIQVVYDSFRTLQFQDPSLSHVRLMDASIHALLDLNFCGQQDWRTMDSNKFFESLLREYPEARNSSQSTTEERFRNLDKRLFRVDIDDPKCHDGLFLAIQAILEVPDEAPLSQPRIEDLCKILTRMIGKDTPANKRLQLHMESTEFKPTKLNDWFWRVRKEMDRVYQATLTLREYGVSCEQQRRDDKGHDKGNGGHKDHEKPKGKRIRDAEECTSCGRQNHTTANCLLKTHPDANKSAEPWPQSVSGKACKAKSEEVLPFMKTLSGEPWTCPVPLCPCLFVLFFLPPLSLSTFLLPLARCSHFLLNRSAIPSVLFLWD